MVASLPAMPVSEEAVAGAGYPRDARGIGTAASRTDAVPCPAPIEPSSACLVARAPRRACSAERRSRPSNTSGGSAATATPEASAQPQREPTRRETMMGEIWAGMVNAVMARRDYMAHEAARYDLTLPQAHLLGMLEHGAPKTMSALAEALTCHASNVTGMIDRLEVRNLIVRQPDKNDRRVKTIALTPEGTDLAKRLLRRMLEPPPSLGALAEPELVLLHSLMQRTCARIAQEEAGATFDTESLGLQPSGGADSD